MSLYLELALVLHLLVAFFHSFYIFYSAKRPNDICLPVAHLHRLYSTVHNKPAVDTNSPTQNFSQTCRMHSMTVNDDSLRK